MENLCQSGVRTSDCSATLIQSCLRHENKLIKYQFEVFRPWNDLKSLVKESLGLKLCLWGIIFNLALSSDGLFFKLPIVRMPTKKVLLWDCLCLGLAFISFLVTDDSAFRSSNHSLVPLGGRGWPAGGLFAVALQMQRGAGQWLRTTGASLLFPQIPTCSRLLGLSAWASDPQLSRKTVPPN